MIIVISVQVERADYVAEGCHIGLAPRSSIAPGIGWSHIHGKLPQNIGQSHLVPEQLVVALLRSDSVQVFVSPYMTGYLVALGVHPLNDGLPRSSFIDRAFGQVVASDEKRCFGTVLCEESQKGISVEPWAIIVSDGHSSWHDA